MRCRTAGNGRGKIPHGEAQRACVCVKRRRAVVYPAGSVAEEVRGVRRAREEGAIIFEALQAAAHVARPAQRVGVPWRGAR